jgi:hypothetical protein
MTCIINPAAGVVKMERLFGPGDDAEACASRGFRGEEPERSGEDGTRELSWAGTVGVVGWLGEIPGRGEPWHGQGQRPGSGARGGT